MPERNQSVEQGWQEFARLVVPEEAHPDQSNDMKRAFVAGVAWLFDSVMLSLDPGQETTDNDLLYMTGLQVELQEFRRKAMEGKPL